ncbi:hypothetical protein L1987_62797 [Smallanthus sonchifolius]|uniref:Uncharacterized protein n=1 Tax=Smallanthus sonchifolius TaxID=185202 RepID=A0ACB9CBJ5_9ASTR|nr:hypothetical protein L1987_62797 [Smallanthus sonchifolius]
MPWCKVQSVFICILPWQQSKLSKIWDRLHNSGDREYNISGIVSIRSWIEALTHSRLKSNILIKQVEKLVRTLMVEEKGKEMKKMEKIEALLDLLHHHQSSSSSSSILAIFISFIRSIMSSLSKEMGKMAKIEATEIADKLLLILLGS